MVIYSLVSLESAASLMVEVQLAWKLHITLRQAVERSASLS